MQCMWGRERLKVKIRITVTSRYPYASRRTVMSRATGSTTGRHGALNVAITTIVIERMAGTTRLELATSAVTGQRSNQLNYVPTEGKSSLWWALKDLNLRPFGCKPNALTAELSALLQ